MQEKMKKSCKSFLIVVCLCMLLIPLGIELSCDAEESPRQWENFVSGTVYYSDDGLAKIYKVYEGEKNWSCINITAYCIEEYESGIVDLAVDSGDVDNGTAYPGKLRDEFKFNPSYQWGDNPDKEHIAVGECEINGSCYVFITNFFYILTMPGMRGWCNHTEWEPIPAPELHMYEGTWITILIPKFKNPRKELYNNLTTNADNTIGFAVYRDGERIGNATYSNETHYFFKDENTTQKAHYYAVAPIAKGGYVTFGKSAAIKMPVKVALTSPNGGEDWSGNTSHIVSYTIHACEPPYAVNLSYSIDGINWSFIDNATYNQLGTYTYYWPTPSIDSSTVKVKVSATDNKSVTDFDESNSTFEIDSKPPNVKSTLPGNGSSCSPTSSIAIEFDEFMNKTSVEAAFSYTNGTEIWTSTDGEINWSGSVMMFTPYKEFESGMEYNCTISIGAKDDSDPGNAVTKNYTWCFVAAPGRGNFSVNVYYPSTPIPAGEKHQIKVDIINKLEGAENRSGGLIVKFLKSTNGKDFSPIDTKIVSEMFPGNSTTVYMNFSLSEGTWWLKVNFMSTNPDDIINGYSQYYETTAYVIEVVSPKQIPEKGKEIGPVPYMLITVMVIAVIVIAAFVLLSLKKKGKLTQRKRKWKRKRL